MNERINVVQHPSSGTLVSRPRESDGGFDDGGGGGDDGRMEGRLSEVEKAIVRIDGRFEMLFYRLDEMGKGISNLRWWILGAALSIVLTAAGTGVAIQQMTVSTFQAAAEATAKATADLSVRPQQPTIIIVPGAVAPPSPAASR